MALLTGAVMWSVWLPEKGAQGKFYSSMAPMIVNATMDSSTPGNPPPRLFRLAEDKALFAEIVKRAGIKPE